MSERREEILRHISKNDKGLEIGPWFAPLAPKSEGFNCLTLDVFDGDTLRKKAAEDPNIAPEKIPFIQDVDIVGTSTDIAQLVAARNELSTFDYIVSSHNFEHLPNPVRFLEGCGQALKPGGLLSMAVPDRRACFDHFRPNSRLSEWLQAYFENRSQPTLAQQFDQASVTSLHPGRRSRRKAERTLRAAYDAWVSRKNLELTPYCDTHCWTFTPTSFELLILELSFLGLSPFETLSVSPTIGNEFFVHLRNVGKKEFTAQEVDAFYARRQSLLDRMVDEPNDTTPQRRRLRYRLRSMFVNG